MHGYKAKGCIIDKTKEIRDTGVNHTNVEIFYGWMTTWSNSFLRSYVKKKQTMYGCIPSLYQIQMATQPPKFTLIVWPLDKVILITLQ
jgi:hypothetical protein